MCFKKTKPAKQEFYPSKNKLHPDSVFVVSLVLAVLHSMWMSAPQPGIKPGPCALESQSLKHWTAREALSCSFLKEKNFRPKPGSIN